MTTRKLQGHRSLIESVAGVLSLIIPLCVVRRRGAQRHEATESLIQDREVKAQMRSSLTGILGSVEMLKTRLTEGEEPSLDRYLSIIDRSARRIDQFVSEGEPSPD